MRILEFLETEKNKNFSIFWEVLVEKTTENSDFSS